MSVECQKCARKSQLFLCGSCQQNLRELLTGLAVGQPLSNGRHAPGWIEFLEDAQLGRTRLGESARRSTERTTPLPVRLGPHTNPTADTQWIGSPSDLLDNLHSLLEQWVEIVNTNAETLAITNEL